MAVPAPPMLTQRVDAPTAWKRIDFLSDLHLHAGDEPTFRAWRDYLQHTSAHAVFVLGDLFDVWIGDDILQQPQASADDARFARACIDVLRQTGTRLNLFFLCGNRDFLLGPACLAACAMQGLDDPCVLQLGTTRWLLSHGDALCLEDVAYQQFRTLVRSPQWQSDFLRQPLAARQTTARGLRAQSEQHKRANPRPSLVDAPAAIAWLHAADARVLLHGHTHQPGEHVLADGLQRIVLGDWDLQARPARAQVLRLHRDATGQVLGWQRLQPGQAR